MNALAAMTNGSPERNESANGVRDAWVFPTSFAQRRLWFMDQVEPGNTVYNVPLAFCIHGRMNPGLLEQAFAAVIARHEILRTTFREIDGEPMQIVSETSSFHLPVIDLRTLPAAEQETEKWRVIREESDRPFDLSTGPLFHAALLDLHASEQVLVVSQHHIITDSWSEQILMRELTAAYSALAEGAAPSLPELPIQYADFAAWQRDEMRGENRDKDLRYWRERLNGMAPLDLPHPPKQLPAPARASATYTFDLPDALTAPLRAMAQREGITVFMALLTGWKCLLARYSGQSDVTVGSPISNRGRTETEGLIGFFLNPLVLRTDLSENPTVGEALRRVRDTTLGAFAHQDFPFEMIVEELQPAREPGKNPIFRVMFVFLTGQEKTWRTADAEIERLPVEESKPKFDLTLHLRDVGSTVKGALTYDKALFTPEMVRLMARHYETLLTGLAANVNARVNSLPLADPEERDRILHAWNDTAVPFPADRTVDALFCEQARLHPNAVAVEDGDKEITYGELNVLSDTVAANLRHNGVKPGDAVAIMLQRSSDYIAGILGILKTGATYVPLNVSSPPERLELMLRESGARFLIGSDAPPTLQTAVWLPISSCLTSSSDVEPSAAEPRASPLAPAYIMFTSGSTGIPKGVRVRHQGISRLVINTNYVQFTSTDVVAHASNTAFDASTFEIWGALLHGARLVIVQKETLLSPQELSDFIRDRNISVLFLTTPLFNRFAHEIPGAFGSLRYLVAGGDVMQPEAARAVLETARPAHLVNGYGPTEVTTFAICDEVNDVAPDAVSIPIGRPISNTRAYILDAALEIVPVGIAGELHLGGPGVADGYVNNPEGTSARFIPDPFSEDPASRLYKTGDLARWREDGIIEFLGRADDQVKIRGYRIELGEIETAIRQAGSVGECKVVARPISNGELQLAAYLTRNGSGPLPTARALRESLMQRLPDYMIPADYIEMPHLPLTANGKVAVKDLPRPDLSKKSTPSSESQNTLHSQLVEIWQEALERKPIGIQDDFFELGGHSLLAVRMLSMVEERLGVRPGVSTLFEKATIEHLAASLLNERQAAAAERPFIAIHPEGKQTPYFFLHGDFVGGGFFCRGLVREIGDDRPFYVIHPHGLEGDKPPRSISVMAAERLAVIREIRPHGPYLLGGYCNGALVAFEIARRLEAEGESVPAVVMFMASSSAHRHRIWQRLASVVSTLAGDASAERDQRFLSWRRRLVFGLASARHYAAAARDLVRKPWPEQSQRLTGKMRRIINRASAPASKEPVEAQTIENQFWEVYRDASESYVPHRFGGKLVLLWPREQSLINDEDPTYGWDSVSPDVELIYVPGDHDTSITRKANLSAVGKEMRRALDAANVPEPLSARMLHQP